MAGLQKQINAIESNQKVERKRAQNNPQQGHVSDAFLTTDDIRQINAGVGGRESVLTSQEVQQINAQARIFPTRQASILHNPTQGQGGVCHDCRSNGQVNCNHCFRCGSQEHVARGCRRSNWNSNSLNSGGLSRGGRQSQN